MNHRLGWRVCHLLLPQAPSHPRPLPLAPLPHRRFKRILRERSPLKETPRQAPRSLYMTENQTAGSASKYLQKKTKAFSSPLKPYNTGSPPRSPRKPMTLLVAGKEQFPRIIYGRAALRKAQSWGRTSNSTNHHKSQLYAQTLPRSAALPHTHRSYSP